MIRSLYKYMPYYQGAFFDNFLIRASTRWSLNDPFEVLPSEDYFCEACIKLGHKRFGETEEEIKAYFSKNTDTHKLWENFRIQTESAVAIISFTETNDNLLMWAHYANEHKGVVIEFDPKNVFFTDTYTQDNDPYYGRISRVLYRKQRLAEFHDFSEPYFHKSDEWIYEKEHRLLVDPFKADKRLIAKDLLDRLKQKLPTIDLSVHNFSQKFVDITHCAYPGSLPTCPDIMFMCKVPESAIKSVIFGARMSRDERIEITKKIDENLSLTHVARYCSQLDSREYKIGINKL